jgi:hypothetical protein
MGDLAAKISSFVTSFDAGRVFAMRGFGVAFTSEDRVRDVIHNFNADG